MLNAPFRGESCCRASDSARCNRRTDLSTRYSLPISGLQAIGLMQAVQAPPMPTAAGSAVEREADAYRGGVRLCRRSGSCWTFCGVVSTVAAGCALRLDDKSQVWIGWRVAIVVGIGKSSA